MGINPVSEFECFVEKIKKNSKNLRFIPLRIDKSPDVERGESWKDEKYKLSIEQAKKRIQEGKAVGLVFQGDVFCLDCDIYKLSEEKQKELEEKFKSYNTLTVKTPSGGLHFYFFASDPENFINTKMTDYEIELRFSFMYVVVPGSFCQTKSNPKGGYYFIENDSDIQEISSNELLWILKNRFSHLLDSYKNEYGLKLSEICLKDPKLFHLLENPEKLVMEGEYPSRSEVSFALISKLWFWRFSNDVIKEIVRTFHPYKKTERDDWFEYAFQKMDPENRYNPLKEQIRETVTEDEFLIKAKNIYDLLPYFFDPETGFFYVWNNEKKVYEKKDDIEFISYILNGFDVEDVRKNITKSEWRNRLITAFKIVGIQTRPSQQKPNYIKINSQVFDLETDMTFDATPNFFFVNNIPWEIGESEDTPIIDKLFSEWVGENHKQILYEICAYCLLPDYPLHRIFILFGSGRNGKGTFLRLLQKFVGRENTISTELERLENSRFETARLYQKLVCFIGETNFSTIKNSAIIKALSGQDLIPAENKHKPRFEFTNYAKLIIATNSIPMTLDTTEGFFSRMIIVDFPNQFENEKDVLSEIPDYEYSNLLRKCLRILKDLLRERKFFGEGSIEEKRKRYEERANPLKLFIEKFCEIDPEGFIPSTEFYNKFVSWLKKEKPKFRVPNWKTEIRPYLESEGFETGVRKYVGVEQKRCIVGLKWKKKEEDLEKEDSQKPTQKELEKFINDCAIKPILVPLLEKKAKEKWGDEIESLFWDVYCKM